MTLWQAILLAIIEGLTEFLPISSTGHMILASYVLGIEADAFTKFFEVNIQLGAILSVVILYWKRFFTGIGIYIKLLAAFVPTAILGLLFSDTIDALLERVEVVGATLFLGGILFLFIDKALGSYKKTIADLGFVNAAVIGCFQAISMIPGVSRSAATIIGGQTQGLSRKAAAEFSFLLAVPTMAAATGLKVLKQKEMLLELKSDQWVMLAVGNIVAFIVAMLAIRLFIAVLTRNGFKPFGYYRIVVGLGILILSLMGESLRID